MILAFKRWIICAYDQVPRDMVLRRYADIPKMILAFQCWSIAYMSKYLETWMYSAYVRRYSKKCFLIFQRWIICRYLLRFDESVSAQNPTMVPRLLRIYRELYKSLFGVSAHIGKKSTSLLRLYVFAQMIQSWKTLLSKITIRNVCTCTQKFPCLF